MKLVDPLVSRAKFNRERELFYNAADLYRSRGIFLIKEQFPDMVFLFAAPQLQPSPVVFSAQINFDNYDLIPLSVRFVDPFTGTTLPDPPVTMLRKVSNEQHPLPLVQKEDKGLPFVCLPGIREYHEHPAHTGDHWLLHRGKGGEGSLGFILDKLYVYGSHPIGVFQIPFHAMVQVTEVKMLPVLERLAL